LIVDRYAEFLVAQFLTAGMAAQREKLLDILVEMIAPRGAFERSDDETAEKEGLPAFNRLARGAAPSGPVEIHTDGLRFLVDVQAGQKTGFFLDQRENRVAAARYLKGRSVLDAFCYTGAFAVAACRLGGAAETLALDRSAAAVELARRNFELNAVGQAEARVAQVAEELRALKAARRRFGAVILDPPKFARSRPGLQRAFRAYRDLNLLSMQLLESDGILVTCSCSGHVSQEDFLLMLNDAAVEAGAAVQVLERRGQAADHPVISSCPETAYLKCFICRVSKSSDEKGGAA
jgi:23S rRNA (cytosine1962-C5)-methyltransferase